mmetsp:Transcript_17796/g.44560  ORF Transcript_17796/g.44560 Transcript_17796/m.44560 type:complete len:240 (+) Transcript_17796:170-889(+)
MQTARCRCSRRCLMASHASRCSRRSCSPPTTEFECSSSARCSTSAVCGCCGLCCCCSMVNATRRRSSAASTRRTRRSCGTCCGCLRRTGELRVRPASQRADAQARARARSPSSSPTLRRCCFSPSTSSARRSTATRLRPQCLRRWRRRWASDCFTRCRASGAATHLPSSDCPMTKTGMENRHLTVPRWWQTSSTHWFRGCWPSRPRSTARWTTIPTSPRPRRPKGSRHSSAQRLQRLTG